MDKRIFGLRNEYSVVFSAAGQQERSPQEVGRRLFGPVVSGGLGRSVLLRNGGRLHLDVVSRPEYTTPGCGNALDLVVHDKAGERILEGLLTDAGQLNVGIYSIGLTLHLDDPPRYHVGFLTVCSAEGRGLPYQVVLGRNVLQRATLTYAGQERRYRIEF